MSKAVEQNTAVSSGHSMASMPIIAFCIEALTVGGAEQMLIDLANQFVKRGWQVHMICLTKPGELAQKLGDDVTLHVLEKKPGVDAGLPGRLRKLFKLIKPSVVNSHLWTANLWTRISLLKTGIPVIVTEHSRDTWKPSLYRFLDRQLARSMFRLVAVSNDTADFYKTTVGVSDALVDVINNGVDTTRYASGDGANLRTQWVPKGAFLVGTVGRMVPAKNHIRLIKTAAVLKQNSVNCKVLIVGDGPERESVEHAISENDVSDYVLLAGTRSDIPDILAALDLFVLSSDREGHPLTAMEAQAAGTAVILTDAGGSADAVSMQGEQVGGLLVGKSVDALSSAIQTLLADKETLAAMSQFGQRYALAHFDRKNMVDQYEALFQMAIAR